MANIANLGPVPLTQRRTATDRSFAAAATTCQFEIITQHSIKVSKSTKQSNMANIARNQYASPQRQCNTGRPWAERLSDSYEFFLSFRDSSVSSLKQNFNIIAIKMCAKVNQNCENLVTICLDESPRVIFTK